MGPGRAADAIRVYEQAKKNSEQARDTYNSQVRTYTNQVSSYNTTAQSGGDPGPLPQPPGEFHDPGLAGVQQAKDVIVQQLLDGTALPAAIETARTELACWEGHEEQLCSLDAANRARRTGQTHPRKDRRTPRRRLGR